MTDLGRMVRRLVEVLEGRTPGGVHRPVSIGELRRELVPYRANRNLLGLSSSEDYDLLVLRLLAEEDGYVRAYPPDAANQARAAITHPNPDLSLVDSLAEATVQIGAAALTRVRGDEPAPQRAVAEATEQADGTAAAVDETPVADQASPANTPPSSAPAPPSAPMTPPPAVCRSCQASLPTHREVVFCPFCGERVKPLRCAHCGTELEAGWRHCITCGREQ